MQVFLTGATGYIGSAVLDAMIKGGHRVTALARDPEKAERLAALGVTPVIGELGTPKTYVNAVKAADAVVHAGDWRARYSQDICECGDRKSTRLNSSHV